MKLIHLLFYVHFKKYAIHDSLCFTNVRLELEWNWFPLLFKSIQYLTKYQFQREPHPDAM